MTENDWKVRYYEFSKRSGDTILFDRIINEIKRCLQARSIILNQTQLLGIASHVSGMIQRSISKNAIVVENKDLFSEISEDNLELAASICHLINGLNDDEKYLLSIHFENVETEQSKGNV